MKQISKTYSNYRKVKITVETERFEYDPTRIIEEKTESHKYMFVRRSVMNHEQWIIDKILNSNFNWMNYFESNMEVQIIRVFINDHITAEYKNPHKVEDIIKKKEGLYSLIHDSDRKFPQHIKDLKDHVNSLKE